MARQPEASKQSIVDKIAALSGRSDSSVWRYWKDGTWAARLAGAGMFIAEIAHVQTC